MFARSAAASSSRPAEGRNTEWGMIIFGQKWLKFFENLALFFTPSSHNRKKPAKSKTNNSSGNRNSNESHGSHEKSSRSKIVRRGGGGGITDNEQSVDRVSQERSNHNITAYQQQHSECNL